MENEIILTPHQEEIKNIALKYLEKDKKILIEGSAGTGKTTLANFILKSLLEKTNYNEFMVMIGAFTHQATQVIKSKSSPSYKYNTIHKILGAKKINDYNNIDEKDIMWEYNLKNYNTQFMKILLIDECSMITEEHLNLLLSLDCYTLFLGDNKQLPPVGENISPIFVNNLNKVELKEIVRQTKNNPIIELSNNLNLINSKINNLIDNKGYVFETDFEKLRKIFIEEENLQNVKFLAFTNERIDNLNIAIRKGLLKDRYKEELVVNDLIIFNNTYTEEYYNGKQVIIFKIDSSMEKIKVYGNNKEILLEETFRIWVINDNIKILKPVENKNFQMFKYKTINLLKSKAINFVMYDKINNYFADVSFGYAQTIHKSQGSTYKKVFIDLKDLKNNEKIIGKNMLKKMLYTAITRASENIYLYY